MNIEESYADKVMRIAKEEGLLYGHIYFCDNIEIMQYGVYVTFHGFVFTDHGIRIPIQTREDAYKMVLIHPCRFREFQEAGR